MKQLIMQRLELWVKMTPFYEGVIVGALMGAVTMFWLLYLVGAFKD